MRLFLFLLTFSKVSSDVKMLKIFGKVTASDPIVTPVPDLPVSQCIEACFADDKCILAYVDSDGGCSSYPYSEDMSITVQETTSEDGCFVAFKSSTPDGECPDPYTSLNLSVTIDDGDLSWKKVAGGYEFKTCEANWVRSERDDSVIVCFQLFDLENTTEAKSFNGAKAKCEGLGAKYKLTGVASVEETQLLQKMYIEKYEVHGDYEGVFIDGVRTCPEDDETCNIFVWSDGYTVGSAAIDGDLNAELSYTSPDRKSAENCLSIMTERIDEDITINDINCTQYLPLQGVACGYKLM